MRHSTFIALAVAAPVAPVFAAPLRLSGLVSREEDILARGASWAEGLASEFAPGIQRVNARRTGGDVLLAREGDLRGLFARDDTILDREPATAIDDVRNAIDRATSAHVGKREDGDVLLTREVKPAWGVTYTPREISSEPSPPSAAWLGPPHTW